MRLSSRKKAFSGLALTAMALLIVADAEAGGKRCRNRCVVSHCGYSQYSCEYVPPFCGCATPFGFLPPSAGIPAMGAPQPSSVRIPSPIAAACSVFPPANANMNNSFDFDLNLTFTPTVAVLHVKLRNPTKELVATLVDTAPTYPSGTGFRKLTADGLLSPVSSFVGEGVADITITVTDGTHQEVIEDAKVVCYKR